MGRDALYCIQKGQMVWMPTIHLMCPCGHGSKASRSKMFYFVPGFSNLFVSQLHSFLSLSYDRLLNMISHYSLTISVSFLVAFFLSL